MSKLFNNIQPSTLSSSGAPASARLALRALGLVALMSAASTGAMAQQGTNVELLGGTVNSWGDVKGVDIAAPNAAGVSRNIYRSISVADRGLVLNNSTVATPSDLAGQLIAANPNISGPGGRAASIIINETIGWDPINLSGAVEVVGEKANVVFVGANGVTCDGCKFVNTSRATLAAGWANYNAAGSLTGISANDGSVTVRANGLSFQNNRPTLNNTTALDLVAGRVRIDGDVIADDVVVSAGEHSFNYANRTASNPSNGFAPGIDASNFGSITAGRIRLIASGTGIGVNVAGVLKATTGEVSVMADGAVQLADVQAATGITIKAANGNVTLAGNAIAGQNVEVSGQNIDQTSRSIQSGRQTSLTATGAVTLNGSGITAGTGTTYRDDKRIYIKSTGAINTGNTTLKTGGLIYLNGATVQQSSGGYYDSDWTSLYATSANLSSVAGSTKSRYLIFTSATAGGFAFAGTFTPQIPITTLGAISKFQANTNGQVTLGGNITAGHILVDAASIRAQGTITSNQEIRFWSRAADIILSDQVDFTTRWATFDSARTLRNSGTIRTTQAISLGAKTSIILDPTSTLISSGKISLGSPSITRGGVISPNSRTIRIIKK